MENNIIIILVFFIKKNGREESILRDKIKLDYARENKIDLLVIPYSSQEVIEPLLIDFFRQRIFVSSLV